MRHTGFPVSKSLDDFDFAELVITEGYGRKELLELGLQRVPRTSCSMARLGTTSLYRHSARYRVYKRQIRSAVLPQPLSTGT